MMLNIKANPILTSYTNLAAINYSDDIDYTIRRIYCQVGDMDKALTHLQKADDDGFDYHWVLLNDPLIEPLRNTELYKRMSTKAQN